MGRVLVLIDESPLSSFESTRRAESLASPAFWSFQVASLLTLPTTDTPSGGPYALHDEKCLDVECDQGNLVSW